MKEFFLKAVRKLRLQKIIYMFLTPFFGRCFKSDDEKAEKILEDFFPYTKSTSSRKNRISEDENDLTVIIAAYNAEKYIKECLDSVLYQKTAYRFNVTVVNDGSTDGTLNILESYKDDKLQIISKENGGLSSARNKALETVKSKYIMFLDADDTLEENAVDLFLSNAYKNDADIVESGYSFFDGEHRYGGFLHSGGVYEGALGILNGFACMKAIKSRLFENVCFPEGFWFEDTIMTMLIFPNVKKSVTLKEKLYNYRVNQNSITSLAKTQKKSLDTFWVTKQTLDDAKTLGICMEKEFLKQFLRQIAVNYSRIKGLPADVRFSVFDLTQKMLFDNFKSFENGVDGFWYKELSKAVRCGQYKKYCLICDLNEYLS